MWLGEEHEAWAVSLQSVAGRLATPLGHIKKKKWYMRHSRKRCVLPRDAVRAYASFEETSEVECIPGGSL